MPTRSETVILSKESSSVVAVHKILRIPYVWTDRDQQGRLLLTGTNVEVGDDQVADS